MHESSIRLEMLDGIAQLILSDPPGNELTFARLEKLGAVLRHLTSLPDVKALIVCGHGRHFSSGANVSELKNVGALMHANSLTLNQRSFQLLEGAPFPVVAAIRGCCFGVGLELAMACHMRIATRSAVFALPEVEHGLIPGCGGTVRLPETIKTGTAIELILSGRTFLADEAHLMGLVDRVVGHKELMGAAGRAIETLLKNPIFQGSRQT